MPDYLRVMTSNEDWDKIVDSETPVIIQCSTSWCRPCQQLKPIMEKLVAEQKGKVILYYVDIEKFEQIGKML